MYAMQEGNMLLRKNGDGARMRDRTMGNLSPACGVTRIHSVCAKAFVGGLVLTAYYTNINFCHLMHGVHSIDM